MTDDQLGERNEPEMTGRTASGAHEQYGVGPFSVREVSLIGVWLLAFIVSFFSVASEQAMAQLLFGGSVWTNGVDWILTIGVPTVAVFLIVLRRFSPDGIRRVGSLGIDQFASVAFSVAAVVWLTLLWRNIAVAVESSVWIYGWVVWVEFLLMLAGVVLTVAGAFVPPFAEDFRGRSEVVAHRNARPIRPVTPRPPRPARPQAPRQDEADLGAGAFAQSGYPVASTTDSPYTEPAVGDVMHADQPRAEQHADQRDAEQPAAQAWEQPAGQQWEQPAEQSWNQSADATETAVFEQPASHQAFWALVPEERDVLDDHGAPLFRIGPTAWALVIEDRGALFVVRHEDGRVGYLHDVSGVMRG